MQHLTYIREKHKKSTTYLYKMYDKILDNKIRTVI